MSLLAVKTFLKKSWAWMKTYWQIPFLAIWTLLVYLFARRNSDALVEIIEAKKESHRKQVRELQRSHEDEILKRDNLLDEYHKVVLDLETRYKLMEKKMTEKQKEIVKSVIIESRGNPDEVRKRIEKEFGFEYVE